MPNILEVPLEADGEVLTVNLDADLPDDPSEICTLLENESCATQYWLAFAAAYARMDQMSNALEVVTKGLEAPIAQTQDAKQPFYSCLAWLYLRKLSSSPAGAKEETFQLAQDAATKAYQLNRHDAATLLANAVISQSAGNMDEMLAPIQSIISSSGDTNVYARFARARVLFYRKNYRGALGLYQSILKDQPSLDLRPDPRIGIGLCYWKLSDYEHALVAWKRALVVDPNSTAVKTMLGVYYLHQAFEITSQADFDKNYRMAIDYMQDAYNSQGETALASITIASYLFSKQNMNHVLKLAERAIESASVPSLIADAWFWKGRVFHFRKDYEQALKAYRTAVEANPQNIAAVLGCGTIELLDESQDAIHTFESAISKHPRNTRAILLCGIAHYLKATAPGAISAGNSTAGGAGGGAVAGDQRRVQRAITLLEKYLELAKQTEEPVRPEALLALNSLYEQTRQMPPTRALEYLQQAIAVMTDDGASDVPLSAAIHSNRGVLAYYCGKYDEARASFKHALDSPDASEYAPTIDFNLARVEDAAGNPDKARSGYAQVLEKFPFYVDAQIRGTFLEIALGTPEQGEEAMTSLLESQSTNLEARALQGWHLRRKIRAGKKLENEEQSLYKDTLMKVDKHDSYSLIAMGNMYLLNAREIRVQKDADTQRKDKAYYKASEFFDKALQIDPFNAYAAQGIAIILAETKRTRQALQILDRACETIQDPTVYLNSGHCLFDLKDYNKAIEMYQIALDRTGGKDATLYTLLGRAWYARGGAQKDVESLEKALKFSKQALEMHSSSVPLQFNVAFLQFQIADLVRRLPEEKRSVEIIKRAQAGVEEAITALKGVAKSKNPPFKPADLEARAETGTTSILPQLSTALESQVEYEQKAQEKLEGARKLRQEQQARAEADLKRKREEEDERERELERERKTLQQQATQWEEERAAERATMVEREPKKRRKSKKNEEDDQPMHDSESDHYSETEAATNGKSTRKTNVISDDEDDDEDEVEGDVAEDDATNAEVGDKKMDEDGIDELF